MVPAGALRGGAERDADTLSIYIAIFVIYYVDQVGRQVGVKNLLQCVRGCRIC